MTPIPSYITETTCQSLLTRASNINYPAGLKMRTNSNKKKAVMQRFAETFSMMDDFRSRLYLSIQ